MSEPLPSRILSAILKIFFSLLYHQFAWAYDAVAWLVSFGRWQSWIYATLPYLTGEKILEIGHGPGHLQVALFNAGKKPFGLDESDYMSRLAFRRLSKNSRQPCLVNGYAQSIPFTSNSYHQVVATFPTEFILSPDTLSEINRILTPGGTLVIVPLAVILGKGWFDRFLAWLNRFSHQAPSSVNLTLLEELSEPYRNSGFDVTILTPIINDSQLVLFLASKPQAIPLVKESPNPLP